MISIFILLQKMKSSNVRFSQGMSQPLAKAMRRAVREYHSNPKLSTSSSTLRDISVGMDWIWNLWRLGAKVDGTDIFWTFTSGSVWNTTLKLVFLSSSAYTVYLMLNDYKPTHDPNIDTFKVQYLIGGSLALAVLFPYRYEVAEVRAQPWIKRTYSVGTNIKADCLIPDVRHRSYGPFRYGWNPSPFSPSCSCCSERAKPKRSRRTICSRWGSTGRCTYPIGCIDTLRRAMSIRSLGSPARSKRFSTRTFSGFTIPSTFVPFFFFLVSRTLYPCPLYHINTYQNVLLTTLFSFRVLQGKKFNLPV